MKTVSVIITLFLCIFTPTKCQKCFENLVETPIEKYLVLNCSEVTETFLMNYQSENTTNLQALYIKESKIQTLSGTFLSIFLPIKTLSLMNLGIEEIEPNAFKNLLNLEILSLASNKLTVVTTGIFIHLNHLHILDLSNNIINTLEDNCFSGLRNLEKLLLRQNQIDLLRNNSFTDLQSLTVLDISSNPLKSLPSFDLPSLHQLKVKKTNLENFEVDLSSSKISDIDLSENYLKEVNFALFPKNFTTIDLSRNQISSTQNWDKLQGDYITINHNNLTEFECFPHNVTNLCLTYNKITHLNYCLNSGLKLEILDLGFNKISEIHPEHFIGLKNLQILNLRNNVLTDLDENTFGHCSKLTILDLSLNKFRHMYPNALSCLKNLKKLYISRSHLNFLNASNIANYTVLHFDHNKDNFFHVRHEVKTYPENFCEKHPTHFRCRRRPSIQSGILVE